MVGLGTWLRVFAGVGLLLANGFFVTTEFAMTRVRQFAHEEFTGHRGLERAWEMTERLEVYLSGCQVGITICSVGLGFVAEPAFSAVIAELFGFVGIGGGGTGGSHGALAIVVSLAVINVLHVVVGEQAPTYLGVERTKFVAKYGGPMLYLWTKLMYPIIIFSDRVAKILLGLFGVTITRSWTEGEEGDATDASSRGQLRREMGELLSSQSVPPERREEVLAAFEIGELPVADVMVSLGEAVSLYTDTPTPDSIQRMQANPQYGRFPLFDGTPDEGPLAADRFVGVVYASSVLTNVDSLQSGREDLRDVAAPPTTVHADTTVADVIDHLQAENAELAVVTRGREAVGIVTATDAFESITGQLEDPMDSTVVTNDD